MISLPDLLLFMTALITVYLLPGPDMALVISSSAARGPRNGLMVAFGLALPRTLHVTLSALGLAALFRAHPILFDGVRWLGAAYLIWLAWKMLGTGENNSSAATTGQYAGWTALQRGVMTNLLNPKALMFCALLLPQFISARHDLFAQYLILGGILVGMGLLFDVGYALAASRFAKRLSGSHSVRKISKLVFSSVFGLAAIRLVIGDS